jgi:hypothetical protein
MIDTRYYEGIEWDKEDEEFRKFEYNMNMSENKWNYYLKLKND